MASKISILAQITVPAVLADSWRFLTVPSLLAEWFADVEDALLPDHCFIFRFGDGDFFVCDSLQTTAPVELRFRWRFMGVGPVSRIAYLLQALGGATTISVVDEGQYSPDVARELQEGWEDFLARLERRIRTGQNARYRWSECITATAILMASLESAVEMCLARLRADAAPWNVRMIPELSRKTIEVSFHCQKWGGRETKANLSFTEQAYGTKLCVLHSGWANLDREIQFGERKRFAGLWAGFLEQLETSSTSPDRLAPVSP